MKIEINYNYNLQLITWLNGVKYGNLSLMGVNVKFFMLVKIIPTITNTIAEDGIVKDLEITTCEKDLGVFVDNLLDFDEHMITNVKKARSLSGLITRTITYKTRDIMVPLFIALIRPVQEYGNAVWCPFGKNIY